MTLVEITQLLIFLIIALIPVIVALLVMRKLRNR
jgi:hypothetical protein